jgi:hypothetical protein
MKKDEMVSVLAIAGADPKTIDAMSEAYEMGFEYGSKAYAHLTEVVECAKKVCEELDDSDDMYETAWRPTNTKFFWSALKKLQELE